MQNALIFLPMRLCCSTSDVCTAYISSMAPSRVLQISAQTQGGMLREKYSLFYPTHCYQYCLSFNNLGHLLCDSCKLRYHLYGHNRQPGYLATVCVRSQWSLAFVYRIPEDGDVYTWAPHPRKGAEGETLETGGRSKCLVFSVVRCLYALVGMSCI